MERWRHRQYYLDTRWIIIRINAHVASWDDPCVLILAPRVFPELSNRCPERISEFS